MSEEEHKQPAQSLLGLGCAVTLLIAVLCVALVVLGLATGWISVESGGSATLPNGATVTIKADWGFDAGENPGETFISIGSDQYVFTNDQVTLDDQVLGTLDPDEQQLILEALGGTVELRSDETGRVIFSE